MPPPGATVKANVSPVGDQKTRQRAGIQQRYVAADHDDLAVEVEQGRHADLDRAPGAGDLVLIDDDRLGKELGDGLGHGIPLMVDDDHDPRGVQFAGGGEHVPDHRHPGDRMQHLGPRRPHAGALPGGEHDDGEARVGHAAIVSGRVRQPCARSASMDMFSTRVRCASSSYATPATPETRRTMSSIEVSDRTTPAFCPRSTSGPPAP